MWVRVIVFTCVLGAWPVDPRRARDVRTTQGYARGYFALNPPHFAFLGLPYAAARTRFKAPEQPPRWDGVFEATHRVRCPQDGFGDENCLVINVFTPEAACAQPVLVFVHDGHFQSGWGSHEPPSKLLSQGLVIVTFNYRLGPLGFLCLKIPEAPGNAGLKDQIAALYWVQMNIERFGGDPYDVTVYGVGSGAAAVQILLLSGLAKGLLHKAILESGSVLSPAYLTYNPVSLAFSVAVKLGYKHSDEPENLVKFFRKLNPRQLRNISEIFLPCVENSYYYIHNLLEEDPIDILNKHNYEELPLIMLYTSTDGISVVERNKEALNTVPERFDILLPNNLKIGDEQKKLRIAALVKELYFDNDDDNVMKSYAKYFHDILFEYPIMRFGVLYADKISHPVYIMKFMHQRTRKQNRMSASHEKLIHYVYGEELSEEDNLIADRLLTLLCNFIKLGDPTPITTATVPVIWKSVVEGSDDPASVRTASMLQFHSSMSMVTTHGNQHLNFWDHVYNSFYRTHSTTEDE